eukprot:6967150-Pyramimonas_sp.AAC.1
MRPTLESSKRPMIERSERCSAWSAGVEGGEGDAADAQAGEFEPGRHGAAGGERARRAAT